jgi:hypothetical protein
VTLHRRSEIEIESDMGVEDDTRTVGRFLRRDKSSSDADPSPYSAT